METVTQHNTAEVIPAVEMLPETRDRGPDNASREYSRLLRELNSWCREHDWPMSGNSWIAEEAVRRSW